MPSIENLSYSSYLSLFKIEYLKSTKRITINHLQTRMINGIRYLVFLLKQFSQFSNQTEELVIMFSENDIFNINIILNISDDEMKTSIIQ